MRRMAVILALSSLVFARAPAGAHACAAPVQVPVGEEAAVTVGITAEDAVVVAMEVRVPAAFRVTAARAPGWDTEVDGSVVRFEGGSVAPFSCGYVTLQGVAEERGELVFPLVVEADDGTEARYDRTELYHPQSAQLVYAGVDVPVPGSGGDSAGTLRTAGIVLVAVGGLVGVALVLDRAGVVSLPRRGRRPPRPA